MTMNCSNPILPDPFKVRALALGLAGWDDTPANQPPAASAHPPAVDLTRPAFGTVPDGRTMLEREVSSYQWGRETYHAFLDKLQRVDAAIEHPLAVTEMREYVLRMAIAYSGHPDAKIAVRALDMLARMKPIGLYEEKRTHNVENLAPHQITDEIRTLLKQLA